MQKQFDRALILLSEWTDSGEQYLLHSARLGWWELPWCDRGEDQSYRSAVAGELTSRFRLNPKRDFIVCSTPRLNLIVHPRSFEMIDRNDVDVDGFGVLEIYPVQLFGSKSRDVMQARRGLKWCASSELSAARVTPQTQAVMRALDLATGSASDA